MRYWLFQNNQVIGPYSREELASLAGFSAESLVCPEGRKGTQMGDWQRAGVVAELAETLLKAARVPAGAAVGAEPGGSLLPPEPTLRDLAVLGTLQEKVGLLENSITQLREDLRSRDTEIAALKVELSQKGQEAGALKVKLEDLELNAKGAPAAGSLDEHTRVISDLKSQLDTLRSELLRVESNQSQLRQDFESRSAGGAPAAMGAAPALEAGTAPTLGAAPTLGSPTLGAAPAFSPPPAPAPQPSSGLTPPFAIGQPPAMDLPEISAQAPSPLPLPVTPPPAVTEASSPALEMPAISPGALSPAPLGGPDSGSIPLGDEIPAVTLSPASVPALELPGQPPQPSPFAGTSGGISPQPVITPSQFMPPEGLGAAPKPKAFRPPPQTGDLEFVDLTEAAHRRKKGRFFLKVLFFLAAVATGGAYQSGRLQPIIKILMKRLAAARAPAPETGPAPEPEPKATPAQTQQGMPDRTQEAIDFAKSYAIAGSGRTLDSALEGDNPPPGLSPWMVEKVDGEKYNVKFYPSGSKQPSYEFEVRLDEKTMRGLTDVSQGLLDGSVAPPVGVKTDSGKKRRKRRHDALGAALLESSLGESGAPDAGSPVPMTAAGKPEAAPASPAATAPAPKKKKKKAPALSPSLESPDETVLPPEEGEEPKASGKKAAKKNEDVSLDELLLPGVPKRP